MKNMYKTEQKKIIKDYLSDNEDKFFNVEQILEYMKKSGQHIGLTTIYRHLNTLEENNEVRTEIRNHTKFYQYISNSCKNHFHLKCKECGKTIHLKCKDFQEVSNHIKDKHKFQLDYNTIIYGLCDSCNKEEK